jgi:transaldolase
MTAFRIFLDTAELDEITQAVSTGLVDGVATNPEKIARSGKTYRQVLDEIREVFEGPIAFQALGTTTDELMQHALEIHRMDPLVAVKVTADRAGLPAVRPLVAEGVRTNATLIFNPAQGLLAGLAGSPFISPFVGRARMAGGDGIEAVARIRRLYDAWDIETAIIGASIKDVEQVIDVILAGAHAVAVPFSVFEAMMEHPMTAAGLSAFMDLHAQTRRREHSRT